MILILRNTLMWVPIVCAMVLGLSSHLVVLESAVSLSAIWVLLLWMIFVSARFEHIVLGVSVVSLFVIAKVVTGQFLLGRVDASLLQVSIVALFLSLYPLPQNNRFSIWLALLLVCLSWVASFAVILVPA